MATTPRQWWQYVQRLCLRAGLTEDDANDCVWAILARYQQRRSSYPWVFAYRKEGQCGRDCLLSPNPVSPSPMP